LELRANRIVRLLAAATGREKLQWGNERLLWNVDSDVAKLPAGRPIDLDAEVRYGLEARPAAAREIGPAAHDAPAPGLPDKMRRLGEAVGRYLSAGGDRGTIQPEMEKLQRFLEQRDFASAEKQVDRVQGLVKDRRP
jgi:hypothetical protein